MDPAPVLIFLPVTNRISRTCIATSAQSASILKTPEGLNIFKKLAAKTDVIVENYRPDVKVRLGIDYATLSAINPRLIYASISGYGQDGPYKNRPGIDQVTQGMSGLMSITGEPGSGPMRAGFAVADMSAGMLAAIGILLAIIERQKSGKGQWVETSLLSSLIFMLDFQAARYVMKGEIPVQVGNDHPTGAPTGCFRAHDGFVNLAPPPAMWTRFCHALGREDLISMPEYATPLSRRKNRASLNAIIEKITLQSPVSELVEKFNAHGIPCGPIYTLDQVFADPQVVHSGLVANVSSAALGDISLLAQPVKLSRTPSKLVRAAPEPGEQTDEILTELGLEPERIARLHEKKVV